MDLRGPRAPRARRGPRGRPGPERPRGSGFDPSVAMGGGVGCNGAGAQLPAGDITNLQDVHYIDTDPRGPATPSGYRQLHVQIDSVDVSRTVDNDSLIIAFQ